MSLPHPLLSPHGASPVDVKQQVEADRRGVPYLLFRDERGAQTIVALPNDRHALALGRAAACDICLSWDRRVSGVHARLERLGGDWTVEDDGLSRNGTFVNGERVAGRRRLHDADILHLGEIDIAYRAPGDSRASTELVHAPSPPALSDAQRRVLVALCRPYRDGGAFTRPASNAEIAGELYISVEAVKTHLRALFQRFDITDVPQNAKRVRLVELGFETGAVTGRDLER
ncbi:MAG TPA: FHA domain-containing protein [Solirubrobacteraceae bacterium]